MNYRTDLAIDRVEYISGEIKGIRKTERRTNNTKTTVIDILDENGEKAVGKPVGKYITVEMSGLMKDGSIEDDCLFEVIRCINELLPKTNGTVLVAGVGNPDITSDALGPAFCDRVFSTRHIDENMKKLSGLTSKLRSVCCVSTDVLGKTGIESAEYIKFIKNGVNPDFIITVDALCSTDIKRLGTTVQLSNTGVSPGSGVMNSRMKIDEECMGVPVIAIGVPTVVSALTVSKNIFGSEAEININDENREYLQMIVTPKDIDMLIKNASFLLSVAVNCALQQSLSPGDIISLIS